MEMKVEGVLERKDEAVACVGCDGVCWRKEGVVCDGDGMGFETEEGRLCLVAVFLHADLAQRRGEISCSGSVIG